MPSPIKYIKSTVAERPTYRTEKFSNLLSDTYQGEVSQSSSGTWGAWLINWSRQGDSQFRLGLSSKASATRWVNTRLREIGLNVK